MDYFRTLGVPLLKGRVFTAHDNDAAARVVIINETLAKHFGGPEQAIGQDLAMANENMRVRTIIGVVESVRHTSLDAEIVPEVYVPFAQNPWSFSSLIVRTQEEATWLTATIREYLHSLDPGLPMSEILPVEHLIGRTLAPVRCRTILVIIFSVVALLLAVVSLYSVVSYTVGQRTHEFGIRMSLGAQAQDIIGQVLNRGLRLTLIGLSCGLAGAWAITRLLQRLLFHVSPTDSLVFIVVALILTGVSLLACLIPARRAAKVGPMETLRYE
jgi:predicted permease